MTTSPPHPCRIVITGAAGFIGRGLVARASAAGHHVLALSRSAGSIGSYEDPVALAEAFRGADAVVHLAARAHRGGSDADFEGNVSTAAAVARAARAAGVHRLVLVSSIGVNGTVTRDKPFDERDAPAPSEPYARSKLRCEQAVQAVLDGSATQWTIVRPPLVYGPDAPGNFGRLVRAVARGVPLPLACVRNRRSLIGVHSLAEALLLCATSEVAANQLFLVADGEDLSTPDIVRCIARGIGRPARLWKAPPQVVKAAAQAIGRGRLAQSLCESLQIDASKARRMLGWSGADDVVGAIARAAAESGRP